MGEFSMTRPTSSQISLVLVFLLTAHLGCGDEGGPTGSGDLLVSVAGNEAVRVGFPHEEERLGLTQEFEGDWQVQFDTFAVSVQQLELLETTADGDGPVVAGWNETRLVDIAAAESGEVELLTLMDVPEGRHDISFRIAPPVDGSAGDVEPDLFERINENGWSVLISGTATPPADHEEFSETVRFDFGFPLDAYFYDCVNGVDGTQGVVVAANRQNSVSIYPHIVHIFWDSLGSGAEDLHFDPLARIAGEDNVVRLEDLDEVDLTSPTLTDDRGVPLYDDAGLLETYTLGAYMRRAIAESFHLNGIGFCKKRLTQ
jgi:hypothetical protein